jgi:hypothetical protein
VDSLEGIEITPQILEEAYQAWRDRLVEDSLDGLPVADATSDYQPGPIDLPPKGFTLSCVPQKGQ